MKEESFLQSELVGTKLFVPSFAHRLMPRPRLLDTLNQGLAHKLTLISAPAGFGKTTLLAQWLHLQKTSASKSAKLALKTAWVSLDATDNNLMVFWKYIFAALELPEPGWDERMFEKLAQINDQFIQPALSALINRILEGNQQFALILDDYHFITRPSIHSTLNYLLDHLPPQLHIFIITRNEPPLALDRLRARRQLLELQSPQLACTLEETGEFLREMLGMNVSDPFAQQVFERTEGWLAGLQLLSLIWSKSGTWAEKLEALNSLQPNILSYLSHEVLFQQPPEVQTFLLYTATLPHFCASLCDAVLDRTDSQTILDYLEKANLFITRLDGRAGWYRYHSLFAEVLLYQLNKTELKTVGKLHKLAEQWHIWQKQSCESVKFVPHDSPATNPVKSFSATFLGTNYSPSRTETRPRPTTQAAILPLADSLPLFLEPLSDRELEVLNLMTVGAANQDIAAQLTVSLNTIKKHNSSIFSKLGVPNRTQAVYLARKLGLVLD